MENVTIVGTEENVLVLATESGERFALAIDEVLRREIRRAQADAAPRPATASPREIQQHIRSGLTVDEVAELLSLPVSDIDRFAGPVIAEREHIINQALAAPVLLGTELEPGAQPTFGAAIRTRLADLEGSEEHWASWKDERGWTVKLEFLSNEVHHDARWSFDPRSATLAPINTAATQLSRQGGSSSEGLIPRLRALDADRPSPYKDESRFDSGAFGPRVLPETGAQGDEPAQSDPAVREAAISRAHEDIMPTAETADLLEALRRRRGQREAPPRGEDENSNLSSNPIALFDAIDAGADDAEFDAFAEADAFADQNDFIETDAFVETEVFADADVFADAPMRLEPARSDAGRNQPVRIDGSGRKPRREALPSWDEIVFGARTED